MKIIFSSFIILTLSLPLFLEGVLPKWEAHLGGVTKEQKELTFTVKRFFDGSYQNRFEKWFIRSLGARSLLIKSDNQINYSFFSQLSSSRSGKAILGREGHLIEKIYIKRAQGALAPKREKLLLIVNELRKLASLLKERGIDLIVLISANKPSLYRDTIPYRFRISEEMKSDYNPANFLMESLRNENIHVIDGPTIFQALPHETKELAFSKTGTHWSEYGSCLIVSAISEKLREIDKEFIGEVNCAIDGERELALPMDRDLLSVANLWFPKLLLGEAPKVVRETIPQPKEERKSALFIGTSFLWSLFHHLNKTPFFSHRDMYYYFKRSVPYPNGKEEPIERKDQKWIKQATKSRYIILEANEAFPHRLGYGFPKRAIEHLKTDT